MAHFDIYQDQKGEWRWRLVAPNGLIIADSGEGYTRKTDVERAVRTVTEHVADIRRHTG